MLCFAVVGSSSIFDGSVLRRANSKLAVIVATLIEFNLEAG